MFIVVLAWITVGEIVNILEALHAKPITLSAGVYIPVSVSLENVKLGDAAVREAAAINMSDPYAFEFDVVPPFVMVDPLTANDPLIVTLEPCIVRALFDPKSVPRCMDLLGFVV